MTFKETFVSINGNPVKVNFVDETSIENVLGTFNCKKGCIEVLDSLSSIQQKHTLIHELAHAFLWYYGFSEWTCNEEAMCNFIGTYAEEIMENANKILKMLEVKYKNGI